MAHKLELIYRKLYGHFGAQHWWPAKSKFEVIVGAILTQNTSWGNVEKAIKQLKKEKLLDPARLHKAGHEKIAQAIRSAGYYNIKTKRLKEFLKFFLKEYALDIGKMAQADTAFLRQQLLAVNGIGPETADSILLYALNKPVFVVDAYTKRVLLRHKLIGEDYDYYKIQDYCAGNLRNNVKLFNEFHALLVNLAKNYCLKNQPRCRLCPLN